MEVKNAVMPNDEQMAGFLEKDKDEPIFMVNLLKFKDKAEYPDKRETDLTGEEAYAIYGGSGCNCYISKQKSYARYDIGP